MTPINAWLVVTRNGTHVHRKAASGIYLTEKSAKRFCDSCNAVQSHYAPYSVIPVTITERQQP